MNHWKKKSWSDAVDFVNNFLDEILEQIDDGTGKVSDDFNNDYPNGDSYHHETHVDRSYDLLEAAGLLDELDDYEETDSGLWEGMSPRDAISAQAAYTYGAAVYAMAQEIIESINEKMDSTDFNDKNGRPLSGAALKAKIRKEVESVIKYLASQNQ